LTKNGLGYILGVFSQTHLATLICSWVTQKSVRVTLATEKFSLDFN
jgi:hypothetical protein